MEYLSLSSNHRKIIIALLFLFSTLVGFQFHGFSIGAWHNFIDGSPANEILFGRPRMVRGDDYFLDLPSSIAQTQAKPSFPMLNQNIGTGQFMVAPIKVPVMHPLVLFRPSTWGYLIHTNLGLPWNWWFGVLGLFYGAFLLFLIISKGDFWLSFLASLSLVNAPFFQCWSFHKVEIALHGLYLLLSIFVLLSSRKPWQIYFSALFFGWSSSCFIFDHMYPAFQITMGFYLICLLGSLIQEFNLIKSFSFHKRTRLFAFLLALTIPTIAISFFLKDCSQTLSLINQTIYPGQRFSIGGGGNLWTLFNNHFFTHAKIKTWNPLGNPSEAGHFFYFFPLVFLVFLFNAKAIKSFKTLILTLFCLSLLLLVFYLHGLPEYISRYTLLFKVTSNRLGMAFGFINLVLLVQFSSLRRGARIEFKYAWTVIFLWGSFLSYIAFQLKSHIPELPHWYLGLGLLFNIVLSYLLVIHKKPLFFFQLLAIVSISFTFSFNPIARGGIDYILNNPLSTEIKKIDRASNHLSKWVTLVPSAEYYGYPSLIRMLGVHAIDGHHGYPHFDLWKRLDPTSEFKSKFNQSGYVSFIPKPEPKLRIESSGPGKIEAIIPNDLILLKSVGVTHILLLNLEGNALSPNADLTEIFHYAQWKVFKFY